MASVDKVKVGKSTYDISPSSNGTLKDFTSNDDASPTAWTAADAIATSDTNSTIFSKVTTMIKNVRWLYSKLGTTDFSATGQSTVTGALSALQTGLNGKAASSHSHNASQLPVSSSQTNSNSYIPTSALVYSMQQQITSLNDATNSLKTSVSEGKSLIATAVTGKGVNTAADATFETMATNISSISTGTNTSDATATAAQILSGKTAYVKGSKVTGTMTNQGAKTSSLNCGGSYTIPAGYHNGSGKITANSLASQTSATATASDIISGKTAWVNGSKLTGTASAGSQVETGNLTISSPSFSISTSFKPSKLVAFMYRTYSSSNLYQYFGTYLFISAYWNGSTLYEFGLTQISGDSLYLNGTTGGSVSASTSGASIRLNQFKPYNNGTPIRWVAWS